MNLKETYNKIAKDWAKDHASDGWWSEVVNKFISFLGNGATVLDIGCGAGIKAKYLSDAGLKVTGIDFSSNMVEAARKNFPTAKFLVFNIFDLDKMNEQFDGVFAQASLLHIPKKDVRDVLAKIKQRMKTNGYFYLAVKEQRPGEPDEDIVKENDYGYEYERFFSYYRMDELKKYIEELNMKVVLEKKVQRPGTIWLQLIVQRND